ncbi:MAG: SDR family oxidoreductase [Betaproteobacteria bacterium]|nr:SDR family oxidoreductase [Betaproteobacteria bacterium]
MAVAEKVAIITGSATGIGAEVATMLARNGVHVVVNYTKSGAEAQAVLARCAAHGVDTLLQQADVSDDGACRRMVDEAMNKWGRVDYLVNNAGATKFVDHADLEGLSAADFQRIFGVNVVGTFQMCRAVAPHMKRAGRGAIVNISAAASVSGAGSSMAYAASKAALNTLTLSLARALGPEIRVNAVCPGMVKSRWMEQGLGSEGYAAMVRKTEAAAPLHSIATPEDIAEPAVWLLENAKQVTGEILLVDAGFRLAHP